MTISGNEAIEKAKFLAKNKGILAGISSGANLAGALKLSEQKIELIEGWNLSTT